MFGVGGPELFIIFVAFGIPLFLGYKLARLKGLNGAWTLLNLASFGVAFLVIGLIKPKPDHATPKARKFSIAAIVVGGLILGLQVIGVLLSLGKGPA